jgi:hypothetical protein
MKFKKRVLMLLAILAVMAAMVAAAPAQRAGFQAAGIAPPVQHQPMTIGPVAPFTSAPVAGFVTSPVAPFGTAPGGRVFETFRAVPQAPFFFSPVQPPAVVTVPGGFHRHHGLGFQQPNTVIVNVPPVFSQQIFPETNIGLPAVSPIPPVAPIPSTISTIPGTISTIPGTISTIPSTFPAFAVGTSRAQVISQLGPPTVTVITSTGETLYFSGGATVIIQNGQVVTGSR